ncbi:MAG TPA: hypothetical protein VF587_19195 [Solirubrobacteraceae bacterium]|jgi:hypothetical protein
MRSRITLAVVVPVLAVAAIAVVTAPSSGEDASPSPPSPPETSFAVLRDGAPASAAARSDMARHAARAGAQAGSREGGAAPRDLNVRMSRGASDHGSTVAATDDLVCLSVDGIVGCAMRASAERPDRPLVGFHLVDGDRWRVSGLMIDGVTRVAVDGVEARVIDNVFSVDVGQVPTTLSWNSSGGTSREMQLAR